MNEEYPDDREFFPECITLPIEDVLDLHSFPPREIPDLLADYLDACVEAGFASVRIIHGKGAGHLKRRVRALLERHPSVRSIGEAPADAGGWGATLVTLSTKPRT